MAEKVRLTQEQADALEELKKIQHDSQIIGTNVRCRVQEDMSNEHHEKLYELTLDTLIKALYIGYELKPKYNAGDWVKNKINQHVFQLDNGTARIINKYIEKHNHIRHATPEEIAEEKRLMWWYENDRHVYEFKVGDLIKCKGVTSEVEEVEIDLIWIKLNRSKGTLTKEIYHQIKVICFAEDRMDMECEEE